jgi:hypothetical protein
VIISQARKALGTKAVPVLSVMRLRRRYIPSARIAARFLIIARYAAGLYRRIMISARNVKTKTPALIHSSDFLANGFTMKAYLMKAYLRKV